MYWPHKAVFHGHQRLPILFVDLGFFVFLLLLLSLLCDVPLLLLLLPLLRTLPSCPSTALLQVSIMIWHPTQVLVPPQVKLAS